MRPLKRICSVVLVVICFLSLSNTALAQDVYVETAYMKVAPGGGSDYADLEALWKPIHQERVNAGNILGWFVYEVGSPSGSEVHHNYVVVTIYPAFEALQDSYPEGVWEKVHPDLEWQDAMARTTAARDMVRGETWRELDRTPEIPTTDPAPILQVAYMKVPAGGGGAYMELESLWKKMHAVRIADGSIVNWGVYGLRFPSGSNTEYNYAAVTGYKEFGDLNRFDFSGTVQKADVGMSADELGEMTMSARENVHSEVWYLIDYVNTPM